MDLYLMRRKISELLECKEFNAVEAFELVRQVEDGSSETDFRAFLESFDASLNFIPWYRAMNRLMEFFNPSEFETFGYYRLMELLTLDNPIGIEFCQRQLSTMQDVGQEVTDENFAMLLDSARTFIKARESGNDDPTVMGEDMMIPVTLASLNRGRGRPSLGEMESIRDENFKLLALLEVYSRRNIKLREKLLHVRETLLG